MILFISYIKYNILLVSQERSLEWLGHAPKFTKFMWGIASIGSRFFSINCDLILLYWAEKIMLSECKDNIIPL